MTDRTILLTAGGTGGHLFPSFALAEELQRRDWTVDLVTDRRGDRYGFAFPARKIYRLPADTVRGGAVAAVRTGAMLSLGFAGAAGIILSTRPKAIIGFGGYPTLAPILAARMLRVPSAIHEQNAVMGRANRLLASRVSAIGLSFKPTRFIDAAMEAKARYTGAPVRDVIVQCAARPYRPLEPGQRFTLLVFGGSQGAKYFSDSVPDAMAHLQPDILARLAIVQQCREEDMARVRAVYEAAGVPAQLATFFRDLPDRIASAHLVIARSGASTVAELAVMGRPSILVPLPHALDNDQLENATRLADAGGAWCFRQPDLPAERLAGEIERLVRSPETLARAAGAAKSIGKPGAVAALADLAEELAARR